MAPLQIGYWVTASAAIGIAVLLTMQAFEHRRYARSRARQVYASPPTERVVLFVPCKGADSDLQANLRPLFEQDHANYELVFIVESVDDGAYEPIRRLIGEYATREAQIVVAGLATASGQKVHNLLVATENLPPRAGVLAFADADIRPPSSWLRHLTQRLHPFAASTGYRAFVPKRPSLANLLVASIDGAVVPTMFPGIHHKVWGGSWAIRREVFESVRMRDAWQGTLSDDLVAGSVLAHAKQTIALETACILPSPIDVDLRTMLSWVRRQFIIGRFYSPALWSIVLFGNFLGQTVFWGSAAAALCGLSTGAAWTWQPALVVAVLYALGVLRAWTRTRASRIYLPDHQRELAAVHRFDMWCGPLSAVVMCAAMVASAIGRRITWKSNIYEMRYGGQIRRIPSPSDAVPCGSSVRSSLDSSRRAA